VLLMPHDHGHGHGAGAHAHGVSADADARKLTITLALILGFMAVEVTVGIIAHSRRRSDSRSWRRGLPSGRRRVR